MGGGADIAEKKKKTRVAPRKKELTEEQMTAIRGMCESSAPLATVRAMLASFLGPNKAAMAYAEELLTAREGKVAATTEVARPDVLPPPTTSEQVPPVTANLPPPPTSTSPVVPMTVGVASQVPRRAYHFTPSFWHVGWCGSAGCSSCNVSVTF